jgi:hypothetical protein
LIKNGNDPGALIDRYDCWHRAVSERSVAVEFLRSAFDAGIIATMNRQPPGLDFLILLADEQPEGVHERLAAYLSAEFPRLKFGVGRDETGLEDEEAFSVLPILSGDPIHGGTADAMELKPYPEQHVMEAISDAVREFLCGGTTRLN